ncbi:MAG: hypothetical protein RLZ10_2729, partial [Bacteroidota bacterium]
MINSDENTNSFLVVSNSNKTSETYDL